MTDFGDIRFTNRIVVHTIVLLAILQLQLDPEHEFGLCLSQPIQEENQIQKR